MEQKAKYYRASNMITINYLISRNFKFEEEVLENIYEGKTTYLFSFRTDNQEGINDAIDYVKKCKQNGERLYFPEEHTDNQMTFKEANKIRWVAIEMCFPNLRDK